MWVCHKGEERGKGKDKGKVGTHCCGKDVYNAVAWSAQRHFSFFIMHYQYQRIQFRAIVYKGLISVQRANMTYGHTVL